MYASSRCYLKLAPGYVNKKLPLCYKHMYIRCSFPWVIRLHHFGQGWRTARSWQACSVCKEQDSSSLISKSSSVLFFYHTTVLLVYIYTYVHCNPGKGARGSSSHSFWGLFQEQNTVSSHKNSYSHQREWAASIPTACLLSLFEIHTVVWDVLSCLSERCTAVYLGVQRN